MFNSIEDLITKIDILGPELVSFIKSKPNNYIGDYKKSGLDVEDVVAPWVKEFFEKNNFSKFDVIINLPPQDNKNRYPDVEIRWQDYVLAIDIKAAAEDKNPANDLGTLNSLILDRVGKFAEEWLIFVRYSKTLQRTTAVYFDKWYRMVGERNKNSGIVKYREKDGNLRPKSWNYFETGKSHWSNKQDFEKALFAAQKIRAESIIGKRLNEVELIAVLDILDQWLSNLNHQQKFEFFDAMKRLEEKHKG